MAELPFHTWEIWAMESLRSGLKVTKQVSGRGGLGPLVCSHSSFCYAKLCEILSKWALKDILDPVYAFSKFSHPWFAS